MIKGFTGGPDGGGGGGGVLKPVEKRNECLCTTFLYVHGDTNCRSKSMLIFTDTVLH